MLKFYKSRFVKDTRIDFDSLESNLNIKERPVEIISTGRSFFERLIIYAQTLNQALAYKCPS
ncbi:hypothetical protein LCO01nite_06380 [Lapidilactobacillus concavus]|nr:hypothetical protein LCO01nite_06380 [Lapidilactobacillus concavus]